MQELQGHISAADARYAVLKNAFPAVDLSSEPD